MVINGKAMQSKGSKRVYEKNTSNAAPSPGKRRAAGAIEGERLQLKKQKRQDKQAAKQDLTVIWEKLRRHDIEKQERADLVEKIRKLIKGKVADYAASHVTARVIQAVVKYGTDEDRQRIFEELKPSFLEYCKSSYGHFIVNRLIQLAKKDQLSGYMQAIQSHTAELLRHPCGASVVDTLYDRVTGTQRSTLAAHFYGREFTLFPLKEGSSPLTLRQLITPLETSKQRDVLRRAASRLNPILEKGLVDPVLSHRLIADYLDCAPASLVEMAVETLAGPALLRMVHTAEGAQVGCCVLAYGTPKDRKSAVKAMKGHVRHMATDVWAHTVLVAALSHTDDTKLLCKNIIKDLVDDFDMLCKDPHGSRVILALLNPSSPRYLPAHLRAIVFPPPKQLSAAVEAAGKKATEAAAKGEANEAAEEPSESAEGPETPVQSEGEGEEAEGSKAEAGAGTSGGAPAGPRQLGGNKKPADVRRRELLEGGLAQALAGCAASAGELLSSTVGCDLVVEVARGAEGGLLEAVNPKAVEEVQRALVELAAQAPAGTHAFESYFGSRAMKRLITLAAAEGASNSSKQFVDALWKDGFAGKCSQWIGTHGEKVVAAVARSSSPAVKKAAKKELSPLLKQGYDAWLAATKSEK